MRKGEPYLNANVGRCALDFDQRGDRLVTGAEVPLALHPVAAQQHRQRAVRHDDAGDDRRHPGELEARHGGCCLRRLLLPTKSRGCCLRVKSHDQVTATDLEGHTTSPLCGWRASFRMNGYTYPLAGYHARGGAWCE